MTARPKLPISLKIVAGAFLLVGLSAACEIIRGLLAGHFTWDMGVLGLLISWGLWRLQPAWRTFALVVSWCELVVAPFLLLPLLGGLVGGSPRVTVTVIGWPCSNLGLGTVLCAFAAGYSFLIWQTWVLMRSETRQLFYNFDQP